ncbi:Uma2 family endonuclease [Candidatus Gracilibacteria bacterium]|nr:Uma2 family endonuclease [Candidatus Gracilibacteria bacterium]NJM86028.1 Uma2 family endonuclease [Hydrococcus sp. RU_2_2]
MISILLKDIIDEFESQIVDPEERFTTTGVSWEQYEALLARLGDSLRYRVTYLEGTLEIMSSSRPHERRKKNIGMFLEAYFQETRISFWGLGSTTFRKKDKQGGTEPDESYCIGTDKEFPDLAIEVVVTSGGIDKLAVYKKLGVKEVWFWQNNHFSLYYLRGDEYEQITTSELLPNLDLALLAQYVVRTDTLEAILEFREQIRQNK